MCDTMADFYAALDKSDDDSDYEDVASCMITGELLQDADCITLECGHVFNYDAIFADIYNAKRRFRSLEIAKMGDNQIRCPYCRNIQTKLLPMLPGKKCVPGINKASVTCKKMPPDMTRPRMYWKNYRAFADGYCCHGVTDLKELILSPSSTVTCTNHNVIFTDYDERVYCKEHLKEYLAGTVSFKTRGVRRTIAAEKREVTVIVQQEKALAKRKAALIANQVALKGTVTELQKWFVDRTSKEALAVQMPTNATPTPVADVTENTVVSQSISIIPAVKSPAKYVKPKCVAIMKKYNNYTRCPVNAICGDVFCTKHFMMFSEET